MKSVGRIFSFTDVVVPIEASDDNWNVLGWLNEMLINKSNE